MPFWSRLFGPDHKPRMGGLEIFKYIGPGLLVTVGFIDPGNWASNLAAGAQYGYTLLWMVTLSTLMLIVLQHNVAHLGIATGLCLSEAASAHLKPAWSRPLLGSAVLASISTSLAEILGGAINSAMILLAAATFFVTKTPVEELQQADSLLQPLLGRSATHIFAVALLFAGISSTITSGMAAGSIFAGIFKEPYDIRDNHSRTGVMVSLAVAFLIILLIGDPFKGLIYSQMILSIQLPFTVFLQVHLTSSERVMGKYRNSRFTKYLLYGIGAVVTVLNVMLLVSFFR